MNISQELNMCKKCGDSCIDIFEYMGFYMQCRTCGTYTRSKKTREEAIKYWNQKNGEKRK